MKKAARATKTKEPTPEERAQQELINLQKRSLTAFAQVMAKAQEGQYNVDQTTCWIKAGLPIMNQTPMLSTIGSSLAGMLCTAMVAVDTELGLEAYNTLLLQLQETCSSLVRSIPTGTPDDNGVATLVGMSDIDSASGEWGGNSRSYAEALTGLSGRVD